MVSIGLIAAAYFYLKSYARAGEAIAVPEIEGFDIIEAEAILKKADLKAVVVDSLYMPEKRGGVILDQEPNGLALVKSGREIYITISRYKTPQVSIPNVLDQTSAIAINKLTRRGFVIGELIPKPNPCQGCAIGMEMNGSEVKVGASVPKGSTIDLVVGESDGNALTSAPILFGLTENEASEILHIHQLNVGAVIYDDCENAEDSASARIFWQSIEGNNDVGIGDPISVRLSTDARKIPDVNLDSLKALLK
ncbi:MAG: hypothetical protein Salg2KO_08320 [Salibacteraceae bacterium]